jgi:hypothetical protein
VDVRDPTKLVRWLEVLLGSDHYHSLIADQQAAMDTLGPRLDGLQAEVAG